MSNPRQNQYMPDYVSPPGETLLEVIEERGMSQAELACRMGRPKKTINEIIQAKSAITPETALQLERVIGVPARFWNNREQQYRQYLARVTELEQLATQVNWIKQFPVKAMIKKGWIEGFDDKTRQLYELLGFFGIASPEQWDTLCHPTAVAFRKADAFQSESGALSAWLRQGEIEARQIECQPYDAKAFRRSLREVRRLTLDGPELFQPELTQLCAEAGVAVVFVPQLPKARVSGATRWLNPHKALIQLSLRYKKDDQLWFTFFHEAGHILLHSKRDLFLEGEMVEGAKEREANEFAAKLLIPPTRLARFVNTIRSGYYPGKQEIKSFAAEIGVAPGIVVGRLQHDGILPFSHCNDLKRTLEWVE